MRVSTNILYDRVTKSFKNNYERLFDSNEMLSSGKKINRPSDDILGIARKMDYKLEINNNNQYQRNMNDSNTFLEFSDTVLNSVMENLQRLRELSVEGMSGTRNPQDMQAISREARVIKEALHSYSNSVFRDRNVFSGYKTNVSAFSQTASDTFVYQGDGGHIDVNINRSGQVTENVTGSEAFAYTISAPQTLTLGNGATGIFTQGSDTTVSVQIFDSVGTLTETYSFSNIMEIAYHLEDALYNNNTDKVRTLTKAITSALDAVINTRAEVGARLEYIYREEQNNEDTTLSIRESLSKTEDADITEVISEITKAESALQALRQASVEILSQSLLDYLR